MAINIQTSVYRLAAFAVPFPAFREKAVVWAQQFRQVALFEGLGETYPFGQFRNILGVKSAKPNFSAKENTFDWFAAQVAQTDGRPLLGMLTYDLKNHLEDLQSNNPDALQWPELHFFRPEIWLEWDSENLWVHVISDSEISPAEVLEQIITQDLPAVSETGKPVIMQPRISRAQYLEDVELIRQHIEEGDVYELNYCQEFFAEKAALEPVKTYLKLTALSPMPFCGFLKLDHLYLLCASPERYLKQEGSRILSQPIKGTAPRGKTPEEDLKQRQNLLASEKERAENMMIVDLVRNDLSRCCRIGSVRVEELFGIYSFPFVHQMISTISGELLPIATLTDALKASFPMGSMTGAPKVRAMQLIEQYEKQKRGLFSGSIGYIFPDGTADLNVVIRSLQYNSRTGYLSYTAGGAITYDSVPEQEYEETLLKAAALQRALS